jgi:hypothetical protein
MNKLVDIRRENGRRVIEQHGATKIAQLLGHASPSMMSQVFGPRPRRNPTEDLMRRIEGVLNLPIGSLDVPAGQIAPSAPVAVSAGDVDTVAMVIRLVGEMLEKDGVAVAPRRFADAVALIYTDAMEHGGKPREHHVQQVARLLK